MVLISSTKYACESCIKGHRSSTCKHTGRPLYEIKKKGRPVTQCDHCRELRKTKQVHVKCLCELKEDSIKTAPSRSMLKKKASCKVPESAAFPNGLPEALEASVTLHEGVSSDSDHVPGCACQSGGNCNCCTRRTGTRASRPRIKLDLHHDSDDNADDASPNTSVGLPLTSHILARIAELPLVLPKPPAPGPSHEPSSGVPHGQAGRHHTHEHMLFSPYGRAYEYTHGSDHDHGHEDRRRETHTDATLDFQQTSSPNDESLPDGNLQLPSPNWVPPSFTSVCNCDDSCGCPGCTQRRGDGLASDSFNSCSNPVTCTSCIDCSILSLHDSLPPDTALSIFDNYPRYIDEWVRQVSGRPLPASDMATAIEPEYALPDLPTFQISGTEAEQILQFVGCEWCGGPCQPGFCKADGISTDLPCPTISALDQGTSGEAEDRSGMFLRSVDIDANGFLTTPQLSRSRSSSGSSQSSHHSFKASCMAGTVPIFSVNGGDLPASCNSPTTTSPTHADAAFYPVSNLDSDGVRDERISLYDPSWDRMRL